MERVLNRPIIQRLLSARRGRPQPTAVGVPPALLPGVAAGEWVLFRFPANAGGAPTRQSFSSLEAAATAALTPGQPFTLELPLEAGLIQRLSLPPAEPAELEEMTRIQLEKILPYPADAVEMAVQVIERRETETILSVAAVHHDKLLAICQPLTAHGHWPQKVTFHAWSLAASAPEGETSAMLYRAAGRTIFAVCEGNQLAFAQPIGGADLTPEQLAADLPAALLSAELEGVSVNFSLARLDENAADLRPALEDTLSAPVQLFAQEPAAAVGPMEGDGDLSPANWRSERQRSARAARLRQRIFLGVGAYAAAMVFAFLILGVMKFQVARLDAQLRKDTPVRDEMLANQAKWKTLAPAIQPAYSLAEVLNQVCECLPPGNSVLLTLFEMPTPTTLTVQGEAPSAQAAVDFTDRLSKSAALRIYGFTPDPPEFMSNGHAKFTVHGVLR